VKEGLDGRLPALVLFSSAFLFAASLFFTAFRTGGGEVAGWRCLLLGWVPVSPLFNALVWWANPLLAIAAVLVWRDSPMQRVAGLTVSIGGLLLVVAASLIHDLVLHRNGLLEHATGRGPGFYLWFLAFPGPVLFFAKRLLAEPEPPDDDPADEPGVGIETGTGT